MPERAAMVKEPAMVARLSEERMRRVGRIHVRFMQCRQDLIPEGGTPVVCAKRDPLKIKVTTHIRRRRTLRPMPAISSPMCPIGERNITCSRFIGRRQP
eukprot:scaffold2675_cov236-Pinguiococcus_pyrenoidosus.AAC.11